MILLLSREKEKTVLHVFDLIKSENNNEEYKTMLLRLMLIDEKEEIEIQKTPKVSVIIPVYNVEKYLAECLDSVVNQTLSDIEIICVDDGSPDRSIDILMEYAAKDDRIQIIRQENKGLPAARNAGLRVASGDYVYFVDSDDMLVYDALETAYRSAEANQLDILIFDSEVYVEENYKGPVYRSARKNQYESVTSGAEMLDLLTRHSEWHGEVWDKLYRRSFLNKHQICFDEEYLNHEDTCFTLLCMLLATRVKCIDYIGYRYRIRESSIVHSQLSFKRVYYYLKSNVESLAILTDYPDLMRRYSGITEHVYKQMSYAQRNYLKLSDIEKEKYYQLSAKDQVLFQVAVFQPNSILSKLLETQKEMEKYAKENKRLKNEIKGIRNSISYKAGRKMTYVPRMIRGTIRCLKTYGLKYTVKKVLKYISRCRAD